MAFLSPEELKAIGFNNLGKDVKVSDKCSIYAPHNISIGNNVRIDDFCVLSADGENGNLAIGSHIHLAVNTAIFAGAGIEVGDFCTISARTTLYSVSDDYSGEYLIGPTIPEQYLKVDKRPIIMEKYSAIGAHSLVLPGVTLKEGAVLGAMSMAYMDLESWSIYQGIPARRIGPRKNGLKAKTKSMLNELETE